MAVPKTVSSLLTPIPLNHCSQMIHELQKIKGYSLSRIAKRCGVSPSTIRNIAAGNVKSPRSALLQKILILHCKVFTANVIVESKNK